MCREVEAEALRIRLAEIPPRYRAAFATACAERLLPNYAIFCRAIGWDHHNLLRDQLDLAWNQIETDTAVSNHEAARRVAAINAITPHTEDFDHPYTSAALDACVATGYAIEALSSNDNVLPAFYAASSAHDTVYMHLQMTEGIGNDDPAFENRIYRHPFMRRELDAQDGSLKFLSGKSALSAASLAELRREFAGSASIGPR